jgi:hypothetical protein
MAKRKSTSNGYTSKGERPNVSKSIKTKVVDPMKSLLNKVAAWKAGKKVMVTIENPNKKETNKRYIKVPASQAWGYPKSNFFSPRKKVNA